MNTITTPRTNMEVAEMLNQQQLPLATDAPYYNKDVHDYLISRGAEFKQEGAYILSYEFDVTGERMRLLFNTDLFKGTVKVQVWWEEEDEPMSCKKWLTHHQFSIPIGPDAYHKFRQIINAYVNSL